MTGKVMGLSLVAVLLVALSGCRQKGDDTMKMKSGDSMDMTQPTTQASATTYTCTMHPEVVSDKPGKCPKCGMELVVKK